MKHKSTKKPVGCRLEREYRDALVAKAEEVGVEVSDVIRSYIIGGLREEAARGSLFEILALIRAELRECRKDHKLMAVALLNGAGKADEDEALEWAEKNIKAD